MRVLVTGHKGYIGTVMTPMLLKAGHEVVGFDSDLYRRCTYPHGGDIAEVPTIEKGHARPGGERPQGLRCDNLPGCASPTIRSATSSRQLTDDDQSPRQRAHGRDWPSRPASSAFVFASSCSNYGQAGDDMIDETGALNPVTAYGESKVNSEREHRPARRTTTFCPVYPAPGHGLRRVAAPAFRHRPQQSRRLGRNHRQDPSQVGRHALAPDRAHRGHLARLHRRHGGAGRRRVQRGLQRRPDRRTTTASAISPRSSPASCPAASSTSPTAPAPTRAPIASASRRSSRALAGLQAAVGRPQGCRAALRGLPLGRTRRSRSSRVRAISGSLTSTSCCRKASSPAICAAPAKWKRERPPSIDRRLSFAARSRETSAGAASSSDFARLPAPRARGNELFAGR